MKPLGLYFLTIVGFSLLYFSACRESGEVPNDNHVIYHDDYFHLDYQIDLKQDGYILIDEFGERHWVEFGELEEYFLEDNM